MFDIDAFLDRAKAAAGVETDYALAVKVLGYKKASSIYNWRSGYSAPDERAIMKLCALTGDDPVDVAVRLQSMRAANDDAADLWRQVAERLKGVGVVIMAPLLLLLALALYPVPAEATTLLASPSLYIMSNALWRLAYRLWQRRRLKKFAYPRSLFVA